MESTVKDHYNSDNLMQKIKTVLEHSGKNSSTLTTRELSTIDQLHTGGAKASLDLLKKTNLNSGSRVLDAGCGLGGSARLMAEKIGCEVDGIDLADQFIETAIFLTQATHLEKQVTFKQGSVLQLPWAKNTFDAILCQHILMNIVDKSKAISEFYRVLKPGGQLFLHEITKGETDTLSYPLPWASTPGISFLEPWESYESQLKKIGFQSESVIDESNIACAWWKKIKSIPKELKIKPDTLNPVLILGQKAADHGDNMYAGFKNNAICLVEAILKKP